ncbi:RTA1-domain-containing protein [Hyaloscypha variabilis F]|uniref:RTA1-domain-containing protein n=1 Tax=Hyaloscypha variabilis (strain UAMH 11265 / GT02V1 / F) TaxID=1149755 RepID=A0A2J6RUA5_HYAVF|nr:RTA1-domain-containing protein [Hyaloscypha variabilis F]
MNAGNGPFGPVVNGTQIVFFEYRPNKSAGYAFTALFGLLSLAHLIYILWRRAWFFIPFLLGGLAETFGYYGRALASDQPTKVGPFILQNLLILVATPFLAASVYMSLGRIITSLDAQRYSVINMRWMTKIYVLVDIACIISQFIGATLPASGDPAAITKAKIILLGGLSTQLVALSLFIFTSWHVHSRIKKNPPELLLKDKSLRWQNYFRAIEVVTVLMIVRSLVRTIEYLQGEGGYVISHEVFLYACDAALMALVMLIFLIIHPGRFVQDARQLKGDQGENFLLGSR